MKKEEIINRISIARTNAKLSARALSKEAGLNDGYINRLESKKDFLPSMEAFIEIVEACGMSLEQFFYHDLSAYNQPRRARKMRNYGIKRDARAARCLRQNTRYVGR